MNKQMSDKVTCAQCGKVLRPDMEIEYSRRVSEYFCSIVCVDNFLYEYMEMYPVDLSDKAERKKVFGNYVLQ